MEQISSPDSASLVARRPDAGTRLAADRTWLADERTLMAWIRDRDLAHLVRLHDLQILRVRKRARAYARTGLLSPARLRHWS